MFESSIEDCVALPASTLDERLRANELAARRLAAAAYLRATLNCSDGTASSERRLAQLLTTYPSVGDALHAGHITVDAARQICRVQSNARIRDWLGVVIPVLVELAEHTSHGEFSDHITNLIAQLDQDGAFADTRDSVEGRRASVVEVGGEVVIAAHGGDPIQAAQLQAVFDSFAEREYRADVEARRAEHGDDADQHPLPRTGTQRHFDALVAIFAAAAGSPDATALPEPQNGSPIHPSIVVRALLTGHVRRVVIDSRGVVVDYGTKQRLFTGLARQAAMLLHHTCEAPGCTLPAAWSQVDHNTEWHQGGRTDQTNRTIGCGHHNRTKHRQRWRVRRDRHGRAYTLKPDGTIIVPVGERPPDLTDDELTEHTHQRLNALIASRAA